MKKCTWCGKEMPDDASVCPVDGEPLAPSPNGSKAVFREWVSVTGKTDTDWWPFHQSPARIELSGNSIVVKLFLGTCQFRCKDITRIEKRWWWWDIDWDGSSTTGWLRICGWDLRPFMDEVKRRREH